LCWGVMGVVVTEGVVLGSLARPILTCKREEDGAPGDKKGWKHIE
jgi:hypothetical protein